VTIDTSKWNWQALLSSPTLFGDNDGHNEYMAPVNVPQQRRLDMSHASYLMKDDIDVADEKQQTSPFTHPGASTMTTTTTHTITHQTTHSLTQTITSTPNTAPVPKPAPVRFPLPIRAQGDAGALLSYASGDDADNPVPYSSALLPELRTSEREELRQLLGALEEFTKRVDEKRIEAAAMALLVPSSSSTSNVHNNSTTPLPAMDTLVSMLHEEQGLYDLFFQEIIRQVSESTRERGEILDKIRTRYQKMVTRMPNIIRGVVKQLVESHTTVSTLQSQIQLKAERMDRCQMELDAYRERCAMLTRELEHLKSSLRQRQLDERLEGVRGPPTKGDDQTQKRAFRGGDSEREWLEKEVERMKAFAGNEYLMSTEMDDPSNLYHSINDGGSNERSRSALDEQNVSTHNRHLSTHSQSNDRSSNMHMPQLMTQYDASDTSLASASYSTNVTSPRRSSTPSEKRLSSTVLQIEEEDQASRRSSQRSTQTQDSSAPESTNPELEQELGQRRNDEVGDEAVTKPSDSNYSITPTNKDVTSEAKVMEISTARAEAVSSAATTIPAPALATPSSNITPTRRSLPRPSPSPAAIRAAAISPAMMSPATHVPHTRPLLRSLPDVFDESSSTLSKDALLPQSVRQDLRTKLEQAQAQTKEQRTLARRMRERKEARTMRKALRKQAAAAQALEEHDAQIDAWDAAHARYKAHASADDQTNDGLAMGSDGTHPSEQNGLNCEAILSHLCNMLPQVPREDMQRLLDMDESIKSVCLYLLNDFLSRVEYYSFNSTELMLLRSRMEPIIPLAEAKGSSQEQEGDVSDGDDDDPTDEHRTSATSANRSSMRNSQTSFTSPVLSASKASNPWVIALQTTLNEKGVGQVFEQLFSPELERRAKMFLLSNEEPLSSSSASETEVDAAQVAESAVSAAAAPHDNEGESSNLDMAATAEGEDVAASPPASKGERRRSARKSGSGSKSKTKGRRGSVSSSSSSSSSKPKHTRKRSSVDASATPNVLTSPTSTRPRSRRPSLSTSKTGTQSSIDIPPISRRSPAPSPENGKPSSSSVVATAASFASARSTRHSGQLPPSHHRKSTSTIMSEFNAVNQLAQLSVDSATNMRPLTPQQEHLERGSRDDALYHQAKIDRERQREVEARVADRLEKRLKARVAGQEVDEDSAEETEETTPTQVASLPSNEPLTVNTVRPPSTGPAEAALELDDDDETFNFLSHVAPPPLGLPTQDSMLAVRRSSMPSAVETHPSLGMRLRPSSHSKVQTASTLTTADGNDASSINGNNMRVPLRLRTHHQHHSNENASGVHPLITLHAEHTKAINDPHVNDDDLNDEEGSMRDGPGRVLPSSRASQLSLDPSHSSTISNVGLGSEESTSSSTGTPRSFYDARSFVPMSKVMLGDTSNQSHHPSRSSEREKELERIINELLAQNELLFAQRQALAAMKGVKDDGAQPLPASIVESSASTAHGLSKADSTWPFNASQVESQSTDAMTTTEAVGKLSLPTATSTSSSMHPDRAKQTELLAKVNEYLTAYRMATKMASVNTAAVANAAVNAAQQEEEQSVRLATSAPVIAREVLSGGRNLLHSSRMMQLLKRPTTQQHGGGGGNETERKEQPRGWSNQDGSGRTSGASTARSATSTSKPSTQQHATSSSSSSYVTLPKLIRWIRHIYDSKLIQDEQLRAEQPDPDSGMGNPIHHQPANVPLQRLPDFVMEQQKTTYGLDKIAIGKTWELLLSLAHYRCQNLEVDLFTTFLEESRGIEELALCLRVRALVLQSNVGIRFPGQIGERRNTRTRRNRKMMDEANQMDQDEIKVNSSDARNNAMDTTEYISLCRARAVLQTIFGNSNVELYNKVYSEVESRSISWSSLPVPIPQSSWISLVSSRQSKGVAIIDDRCIDVPTFLIQVLHAFAGVELQLRQRMWADALWKSAMEEKRRRKKEEEMKKREERQKYMGMVAVGTGSSAAAALAASSLSTSTVLSDPSVSLDDDRMDFTSFSHIFSLAEPAYSPRSLASLFSNVVRQSGLKTMGKELFVRLVLKLMNDGVVFPLLNGRAGRDADGPMVQHTGLSASTPSDASRVRLAIRHWQSFRPFVAHVIQRWAHSESSADREASLTFQRMQQMMEREITRVAGGIVEQQRSTLDGGDGVGVATSSILSASSLSVSASLTRRLIQLYRGLLLTLSAHQSSSPLAAISEASTSNPKLLHVEFKVLEHLVRQRQKMVERRDFQSDSWLESLAASELDARLMSHDQPSAPDAKPISLQSSTFAQQPSDDRDDHTQTKQTIEEMAF